MSFRFGILGCGGIAGVFAEAVRSESKAAQIAAAASRDRQKAQAWAAERGISKACTYEELLEDPEIDAVYIALPNSLHAEWIARCAEAGKHILCEKPLTRTAAEAEEAVRKAEEAGVVLIEAFIYRFHPQTARIRELLDEGAIGPLRHVEAAFSYALDEEGRAQNIRTSAELAGGALMDVGCYCISFARFAFGAEPLSARADLRSPEGWDVDFTMNAFLEFAEGTASLFASMEAQGGPHARLLGEKGSLLIPMPYHPHHRDVPMLLRRGGQVEEIRLGGPNGFALTADHLAQCVREGRPPANPPTDAIQNMRVIEAVLEAARTDSAVRL